MIEKMRKYSFVLYHQDYTAFLEKLQSLGMVHIEKSRKDTSEKMIQNKELIAEYSEAIKFLQKIQDPEDGSSNLPTKAILNKITQARQERDKHQRQIETWQKHIKDLKPWGHFDQRMIDLIESSGLKIDFHTCLKNHFKQDWLDKYAVEIINEHGGLLYFAVIYTGESPQLEADTFSFHHHTLNDYEELVKKTQDEIRDIDEYFKLTAKYAINAFRDEIASLMREYEFEDAIIQADKEAEDSLRVLTGWIPVTLDKELKSFLDATGIIYFSEDAKPDDNAPIKLKNNFFAKLFEPIAKMYMLPYYNDMDLTPMFAPFFMLFFGFCNADMAYGLIIIAAGWFMTKKAKNEATKAYGKLIIFFGLSAVLMGWVMGSILGFDMKKIAGIGETVIIRENGQIFNFALLLGAIQILFGVFLNAVKAVRQSGFKHGIAPFGTFLFLLALSIMGSTLLGAKPTMLHQLAVYPLYLGLAMIMLFNAPGKNIIINILGGIWVMYNVVTGFFGDILSYIRLFALGVSSAILGFVMNSIATNFLKIPIAGYILFPIFMVLGHTLNLALGALGGFVHPMRLTFVEFFKNAGFSGPGIEYHPFGKTK